jgi:hypothetical protein
MGDRVMTCIFLLVTFGLGFFIRSLRDDPVPAKKMPKQDETFDAMWRRYQPRLDDD